MNARDLDQLERLLSRAAVVVPMREIDSYRLVRPPTIVALRHDVDDNPGSLATAVEIAAWEEARGFRSTYFFLHTASYWRTPELVAAVAIIAELGHEIGIHSNALAEALRTGDDPDAILGEAIGRLRGLGHDVRGVAGHGDPLCYRRGVVEFANDEQFVECARPELGDASRLIVREGRALVIRPRPLSFFGLEYEALRVGSKSVYLSDSGGAWQPPIESIDWPDGVGQLHILQHPDWWGEAFAATEAAA